MHKKNVLDKVYSKQTSVNETSTFKSIHPTCFAPSVR